MLAAVALASTAKALISGFLVAGLGLTRLESGASPPNFLTESATLVTVRLYRTGDNRTRLTYMYGTDLNMHGWKQHYLGREMEIHVIGYADMYGTGMEESHAL